MDLLLTSDWHEKPFAEKKFETQKESVGERIIQALGVSRKVQVIEKMEEIIRLFEIKHVINNGDLQENSKNEQGIVNDEDLESAKKIVGNFEKKNRVKMVLNAGNYELGYHRSSLPLASDPDGGVSLTSMTGFLKLVNRSALYHSFRLGGYHIIFIPYLITEQFGKRIHIEAEKGYILDSLEHDLQQGEKTIIFIHDPDSLMNQRLVELIGDYNNVIELIFCGHYHAQMTLFVVRWLIRICNWKTLIPIRWILRLLLNILFDQQKSKAIQECYRERKLIPQLMKEFNVQIIPAPGGMLGFGGGFLVLETDTLEVTRY